MIAMREVKRDYGVLYHPEVPVGTGADGWAQVWLTDNSCDSQWVVIGALYPDGDLIIGRLPLSVISDLDRDREWLEQTDSWRTLLRLLQQTPTVASNRKRLSLWDIDAAWSDAEYAQWLTTNHKVISETARRMVLTAAELVGAAVEEDDEPQYINEYVDRLV